MYLCKQCNSIAIFRRNHCLKIVRKLSTKVSLDSRPNQLLVRADGWVGVVGLEIHAQISSSSKLFSGSPTPFGAPANSQVSYFDAGLPGTLPVLNRRCVEAGVLTALALGCRINKTSVFDRKHYFYADLPVGYQITQQRLPLAVDGELNFFVLNPSVVKQPYRLRSRIKQLQLEQDSGKSLYVESSGHSLIDLNRAGAPLMELVFEPDLANGEEAAALVKELHLILLKLGTCNCKMEADKNDALQEGSLRIDANVSVHKPGEPFGVRTEIKNLNSIRGVVKAIDFEIDRQIRILSHSGIVQNETRSFDVKSKKTVALRDKENIQDYRFMPEPNLPPLLLCTDDDPEEVKTTRINIDSLRKKLPELPQQMRDILMNRHGLTLEVSTQLMTNETMYKRFLEIIETGGIPSKMLAHFLLTTFLAVLYKFEVPPDQCTLKTSVLVEIIQMSLSRFISADTSLKVLEQLIQGDSRSPAQIVDDNNWRQLNDEALIQRICEDTIRTNEPLVRSFKSGKVNNALQQLLHRVHLSEATVNMSVANKIMKDLLDKYSR